MRLPGEIALVVLAELIQSTRPVTHPLVLGMCGNPHHPRARQLAKLRVLELLRHSPGDEITRCAPALPQSRPNNVARNLPLQGDLNHAENLRQCGCRGIHRSKEAEYTVCGRVR